jgi:hypothetical protein
MLVHEFDDLMEAKPFRPFRVYTADGKRGVLVKGRSYAWHAPADRTVFVATGHRKHIIDLHLVTRFTFESGDTGNGNGKSKRH